MSIDAKVNTRLVDLLGNTVFEIDNNYPILRDETSTYNFEIPSPEWGGWFKLKGFIEYDPSNDAQIGLNTNNPTTVKNAADISIFVPPRTDRIILAIVVISLLAIGIIVYLIAKYLNKRKISRLKKLGSKHVVNHGESLLLIAQTYNVDWKMLVKLNRLKPPYSLEPGTEIVIPMRAN